TRCSNLRRLTMTPEKYRKHAGRSTTRNAFILSRRKCAGDSEIFFCGNMKFPKRLRKFARRQSSIENAARKLVDAAAGLFPIPTKWARKQCRPFLNRTRKFLLTLRPRGKSIPR